MPPESPPKSPPQPSSSAPQFDRRSLLLGGLATTGLLTATLIGQLTKRRAAVFIARNQRYDGSLVTTIRDGLLAAGIDDRQIAGKRILLKPNLVEPTRSAPHLTTHPAVIVAAAEVFRSWGGSVTVGEGPGHVRDTEMALTESGVGEALRNVELPFADLNYQATAWLPNRGKASRLEGFHFPQAVAEADLIVSMPKLKTHHWVGVTAALKNMYGTIPGIRYGWPKNVLHHNGIPETVFDINASLPRTITVVDGIDCMEGDGPILGTLKPMGLILIGATPTAVDATIARIMDLDPFKVPYLALAKDRLGPLAAGRIEQRGEEWQPLVSPFQILEKPHLQRLRNRPDVLAT